MVESATWIGVAMAAIGAVVTIANGILAALRNRTDKEFDVKLALLKDENDDLKDKLKECAEQHKESESERARIWKTLARAEERIKTLEGFIKSKLPGTDLHNPLPDTTVE